MGHERDELDPGLVERLELVDLAGRLLLEADLLDDPRQQLRDVREVAHVVLDEVVGLLRLDVEDADDLLAEGERHGQHRGDEPALVDPADPQEARIGRHVRDDHRRARGRDAAGDALAHGMWARPIW